MTARDILIVHPPIVIGARLIGPFASVQRSFLLEKSQVETVYHFPILGKDDWVLLLDERT
jgi:hypothetical protein